MVKAWSTSPLPWTAPSTVHSHLSSLVKAGYIRRDPSKPRAIEILTETETEAPRAAPYADDRMREVPLVGRIAAGSPILATEDIETVMPLPEELVGSDPVFMLEVRGDSMIDAGILDGDYVVVRRQPDARDGESIAALVDGEEATGKRLKREGARVVLITENPALEPTPPAPARQREAKTPTQPTCLLLEQAPDDAADAQ